MKLTPGSLVQTPLNPFNIIEDHRKLLISFLSCLLLFTNQGSDGQSLLSGRCLVALTHADSALQMTTLNGYLEEIRGDPLHRLLTGDLKGNILAINNTANTEYERQRHQRAVFSVALRAQRGVQRGSALNLLKCGIWWMVHSVRRNRMPKIALIGAFGIAMLFWQQGWIRI